MEFALESVSRSMAPRRRGNHQQPQQFAHHPPHQQPHQQYAHQETHPPFQEGYQGQNTRRGAPYFNNNFNPNFNAQGEANQYPNSQSYQPPRNQEGQRGGYFNRGRGGQSISPNFSNSDEQQDYRPQRGRPQNDRQPQQPPRSYNPNFADETPPQMGNPRGRGRGREQREGSNQQQSQPRRGRDNSQQGYQQQGYPQQPFPQDSQQRESPNQRGQYNRPFNRDQPREQGYRGRNQQGDSDNNQEEDRFAGRDRSRGGQRGHSRGRQEFAGRNRGGREENRQFTGGRSPREFNGDRDTREFTGGRGNRGKFVPPAPRPFTGGRVPPPPPEPKQQKSEEQGSEIEAESGSNDEQNSQHSENSEQSHSQSGSGSAEPQASPPGMPYKQRSSSSLNSQPASPQPNPMLDDPSPSQRNPNSSSKSIALQRIDLKCSEEQFNQRLDTFTMNNRDGSSLRLDTGRSFAIFEINRRTNEPDYALALKRYRRSTNRSEEDEEKDEGTDLPRSRRGLHLSMQHIQKEIIDADNLRPKDLAFPLPPGEQRLQFLHIFDFLWNRKREMIKDVSRLELKERVQSEVVDMCEQMLRFFVVGVREGRLPHQCRLEFDPKMNLESMTKILTQLLEIYEAVHHRLEREAGEAARKVYISPNQPEIVGYAIIISNDIQNTLNEKLMLRLDGHNLDHPLLSTPQIQKALQIKRALRNKDYQAYYRILQDPQTDYVLACLLLHHLPLMRRETLRILYRASQTDPATKRKRIPESFFRQALRFKFSQSREFAVFLQEVGGSIRQEGGESYVLLDPRTDYSFEDCAVVHDFRFEHNKLSRVNYPTAVGTSKRLNDPTLMSREELTRRNWYNGTYSEDVRAYYRGEEPSEVVPRPAAPPRRVQPAPIITESQATVLVQRSVDEQKQKEEKVVEQKKPDFTKLQAMKKEMMRGKFLQRLQGLIAEMVRSSDIHNQKNKKEGVQKIVQIVEFMRTLQISHAFTTIAESTYKHRQLLATANQLLKAAAVRQQFREALCTTPYRFRKHPHLKTDGYAARKMSMILEAPSVIQPSIVGYENVFLELASKQSTLKKLSVLILFNSEPERPLSPKHISFLVRFHSFLWYGDTSSKAQRSDEMMEIIERGGSLKITRVIESEEDEENRLQEATFELYHWRKDARPPFLGGRHAVLFLDLHRSLEPWLSLVQTNRDNRNKLLKYVQGEANRTNIGTSFLGVMHVSTLQKDALPQSEQYKKELQAQKNFRWWSSWCILQRDTEELSPMCRRAFIEFFQLSLIEKYPPLPDLLPFPVAFLMDDFKECYKEIPVVEHTDSLTMFEEYFNLGLDQIRRTLLQSYHFYEVYPWAGLLGLAERSDPNYSLIHRFTFLLELLDLLHMHITENFERLTAKSRIPDSGIAILSQAVEQYLQAASKQQRTGEQRSKTFMAVSNSRFRFEEKGVTGNCTLLLNYICSQLASKLASITVPLPRDYRVALPRALFTKAKLVIEIDNDSYDTQQSYPKIAPPSYKRSSLLRELEEEIASQSACRKYVKTNSN